MASLTTNDGYLKFLAQEAKKNDTAFMDIIKEFLVLYNRACADFKDWNIKNNAWRTISELLDIEESKCRQRYKSIRATFSRYVRKALWESGTGRDDILLDPKYEYLRWLATFIKARPTSGNVQSVPELSEEQTNSDDRESEEEEDKSPTEESSLSSKQKDSAEPDGKKPFQKKLKKTLPKKRSWSPAVSVPDPNLELCKVMHGFQKSLDASCKTQTPLKTDKNSGIHYCLSLAERMSGLDNKTTAYVRHSIEKLFFNIESSA